MYEGLQEHKADVQFDTDNRDAVKDFEQEEPLPNVSGHPVSAR
jgi:hypothetical protein